MVLLWCLLGFPISWLCCLRRLKHGSMTLCYSPPPRPHWPKKEEKLSTHFLLKPYSTK
uniref:Uncharacterized protein n=1 Tax=Anguilla anguilla TaxID=7936 RepID=A0A0E9X235_ANGAN